MMSPKTSYKGARNPCREMTHENSGWAGHSATADADKDSDVAGYSAATMMWTRGELQVQQSDCPGVNQ